MFNDVDFRTRRHRILALLGVIPGVLFYAFVAYILYLNHRVSSELAQANWKTPTEIYGHEGETPVVRVYGTDWHVTSPLRLETLPSFVPNAFLAAEDRRFRKHIGVDPIGLGRALFTNVRAGGISQGGSTLNQQLIKSKFLTQERTYRRKFVEMIMAVILDARMSKDEILEAYMNEVYLGHLRGRPVLGVDEAARLYFDKRPERLRLGEAALLAAIIRAPNRDNPEKAPDIARARRNTVLKQMLEEKWISSAQYAAALEEPVRFNYGSLPENRYRHYLAVLRTEARQHISNRVLMRGGLKIRCEMDPAMQRAAESAVRNGARSLRSRYRWLGSADTGPLQAALLSIDPRDGGVRAIVGGLETGSVVIDRTASMQRQPGSAFKPFAYLAAIESERWTASTLLLDAPIEIELASNRTWEPHNYDERFRGRVTVREAFEKSLNVPLVRMTQDLGPGRVVRVAKKFGFTEDFDAVPSLPLGVEEVTIRELTAAFTAFPTLGERATPRLLTSVRDRRGKVLYQSKAETKKVAEPAPTFVLHSLMRGVVRRGTASRLRRYGLSYVAGKTGTTSDYRDAWFVGYTPDLVTTVWVGFDRGAALRLSSAEAAIPIWGAYMRDVKTDHRDIEAPANVVKRQIDPESGFLWAEGCPGPVTEFYIEGTQPTRRCPRGFMGRILRRAFFDAETFDEPAAITFDQARRMAEELDRNRKNVEDRVDRLKKLFDGKKNYDDEPRGKKEKKAKKRE